MTTTAQYLKKALTSLVVHAFDLAVRKLNRNECEDVSPDFRHDKDAPELDDDGVNTHVREALCAQDRPALVDGDYAGLRFLEDSSHITDIVHGADCTNCCQQRHTDWLDKDVANDFGKYWISWPHAGTSAKIPENLHEHLRSALLMQNLCEWAVIILLQSVKCIVTRLDPQAQIYQMVVAPRRRFQIMDDSNIIAGTHSLFLISSPLAGDFVLDPTAEQYGIPREHRFLPWSVYKQLYIIDQRKYCGAAVWSTNFYTYVALLQKSARWEFWTSIRAVFDKQTAAWLQDCELRTVMDDHDQWKVKQEQLKSLVVEGLAGVEPEP